MCLHNENIITTSNEIILMFWYGMVEDSTMYLLVDTMMMLYYLLWLDQNRSECVIFRAGWMLASLCRKNSEN